MIPTSNFDLNPKATFYTNAKRNAKSYEAAVYRRTYRGIPPRPRGKSPRPSGSERIRPRGGLPQLPRGIPRRGRGLPPAAVRTKPPGGGLEAESCGRALRAAEGHRRPPGNRFYGRPNALGLMGLNRWAPFFFFFFL
jgi:hypothetical protein